MSAILYKPQKINTAVDPALQYLNQREQDVVFTNVNNAGDSHSSVILQQVNSVVTNVTRNDPADTVLDLVDLNLTEYVQLDSSVTATIITGEPIDMNRAVHMAPASSMTGRRMIVINRSSVFHLIVKDSLLNTVVVVEALTSEEILSDGYNWIAVN
jgi:hypothetical protein